MIKQNNLIKRELYFQSYEFFNFKDFFRLFLNFFEFVFLKFKKYEKKVFYMRTDVAGDVACMLMCRCMVAYACAM